MIMNAAKGLEFDPQNHIYTVQNTIVPSVTQVIKRGDHYSDYSHVPEHILMRAADIGTTVHKTVEEHILHDSLLTTDDESANLYLDGFVQFVRDNEFEPIHTELMLYDPDLWYAGTIDLVCRVNGGLYVCDIKTTNKLNKPAVELQLAAYKNLIGISIGNDREFDREFDRVLDKDFDRECGRAVIWLKKNDYRFWIAEDHRAWPNFKSLLTA